MMRICLNYCVMMSMICIMNGCNSDSKKGQPVSAKFELGTIQFYHKQKEIPEGYELSLVTRYTVDDKKIDDETSNYFQYQLGKKIKLVIGSDTILPGLFYYVPLIRETEKEVDCKYILTASDIKKEKRVIIDDSILDFNKINVSLK